MTGTVKGALKGHCEGAAAKGRQRRGNEGSAMKGAVKGHSEGQ